MRVAFLGLGIMGQPMAANLAKAGHDVVAWTRSPGKTVDGARVAATPAEAAADAEVVWICVSDTAAVNEVLWGENGAGGALKPGVVVVDSAGVAAMRAPSTVLPGVRFHAVTSYPAFARLAAIGCPMIPSPRKVTRMNASHNGSQDTRLEMTGRE